MNFWQKVKLLLSDKGLRNKLLFVVFILFVFRLLANVPIPGIDASRLGQFLAQSQLLGVLNIFSGGGLSNLSLVMLGVGPYITASIILQVLTLVVPSLKALYSEEGEAGKKKFTQYGRLLTVPLAALQGYSLIYLLSQQGVIDQLYGFALFSNIVILIAGSLIAMWLGELISEYGIGNGVSMIIFAGIVASIPSSISQLASTFDTTMIPLYIAFVAVSLAVIAGVIFITEAERLVPVTYARQVRGVGQANASYLPIKLNQAGVIPIIFALSILVFPQIVGGLLANSDNSTLASISTTLSKFTQDTWLYPVVYFVLVFFFTYFYTAVTFDPKTISDNLQRNGAFVSGIRPGQSTSEYIGGIVSRVTTVGALFLGVIAILPIVITNLSDNQTLAIGGTSLLIAVSVILDLVKKLNAQLTLREY
jgi:preprotein translocase subunit SecY